MCNSAELLSWTVVFAVESLVIIAANIITIVIFWKLRFVLKRTYYLLINLTVADVIVGFGVIEIVTKNIWKLETSEPLRSARFIAVDMFSGSASMTSLLLIAVDRFLAIVLPFRHRALTKRNYMQCIIGVWFTALVMTVTRLLPEFVSNPELKIVSLWIIASLMAICLIAMCCLYTAIWISSKKDDPRIPRDKRERNKRLAKTLFIVTATSVATWLPFAATFVLPLHVGNHENCILQKALLGGRFLQLANSFLNPVVYCYRMEEFSRTLKQIVITCGKKSKVTDHQSLQSHIPAKLPVSLSLS